MKGAPVEFDVKPYESAGSIRFGMTAEQVRGLLSPQRSVYDPVRSCETFPGDLGIRVHYGLDGSAEAIEFRGPASPVFGGRRLLRERYGDLEAWFASLDPALKREHSGLTSIQFGIRLYAASAHRLPGAPVEVVTVFEKDYCRRYIASIFPPPP